MIKMRQKHSTKIKLTRFKGKCRGEKRTMQTKKVKKREVPWMYDFLNPVAIDVMDHGMLAVGKPEFYLNLSKYTYQSLLKSSTQNKNSFKTGYI